MVENPKGAYDDAEKFKISIFTKVIRLLEADLKYTLYLRGFNIDILACECIEYAIYYANKSQFELSNISSTNPRLRLLLLECEQKQVFMLIWRAIKNVADQHARLFSRIEFEEVVDNALSCYVKYKAKGAEAKSYDPPQFMKASVIKNFIEYLARVQVRNISTKI